MSISKKKTAMKIVAYYRVSTKKQGDSGLGLEGQKAEVRRFAEQNSAKIIAEYTEVETGTKAHDNNRPQLQAAIDRARLGNATLVISKLDRLSRNVAFLSALMESGVEFVCCDVPSANKFTVHVLAAVAEEETRKISERTRAALAEAKKKGKKLGSARPGHWKGREHKRGWKKGVKASAKVRAQRCRDMYGLLVPQIRELQEGGMSYEDIAKWLNERDYETIQGRKFSTATVWRIMKRAKDEKQPV